MERCVFEDIPIQNPKPLQNLGIELCVLQVMYPVTNLYENSIIKLDKSVMMIYVLTLIVFHQINKTRINKQIIAHYVSVSQK